jgi:hypothetical protein
MVMARGWFGPRVCEASVFCTGSSAPASIEPARVEIAVQAMPSRKVFLFIIISIDAAALRNRERELLNAVA